MKGRQFVYRFNGDEKTQEVVVDADGEIPIPLTGSQIMRQAVCLLCKTPTGELEDRAHCSPGAFCETPVNSYSVRRSKYRIKPFAASQATQRPGAWLCGKNPPVRTLMASAGMFLVPIIAGSPFLLTVAKSRLRSKPV